MNADPQEHSIEVKEHPNPKQAYRIVMTIENAPGLFAQVGASTRYDATNAEECGELSKIPGAEGIASHVSTQPLAQLEKLSDTSYATTVYADKMVDEDYFGRGVCRWKFSYMSAMLRATGDERETRFLPTIDAEEIVAGKTVTLYFWKGGYPMNTPLPSNGKGFGDSGYRSLEKFKPELRDQIFTITLTPEMVQP